MGTSDTALILQRLLAITDTGLSFAASDFDRERYADIRDNLNQLLSETSHLEPDELSDLLRPTDFYATPLVDVRAFIVQQGKICLVRGQQEETWALPGGFCEVGLSPKENIVKEIQYLDAYSAHQQFYKNKTDGKIIGAYTLTQNLRTILPYKPSVEFENSDIVKNDEVSCWNIALVTINGDENDPNSYQVAGNLNYDDFIKKLPINKYKFIDASYIMVEPLSKEEILDLLK